MNRVTLQLVLLVSCAHSLVHIYELSLPSVEQKIAGEYSPDDEKEGKRLTGQLSNYWRLLWGLGALLAGYLVDRVGSRPMLALYLLGCSLMCALSALSGSVDTLFAAMIGMGALASIYHPAGLALISHETSAENRPRALGIHGIFGSAGIAAAPFLAGAVLAAGFGWREYYWMLVGPGVLVGLVFAWQAVTHIQQQRAVKKVVKLTDEDRRSDWRSFFTLGMLAIMQGFVYSAVMAFLTRYLSAWKPSVAEGGESFERYATGGVLLVGCVGQYLAGRFAKPAALERQLAMITLANAPFLLWMALATGPGRLVAAGSFAVIHFMHQPVYNSLVSKYTPRHRRSFCYGLSFAMAFGFGSFGARFAGNFQDERFIYSWLAVIATAAACVGLLLWWFNRPKPWNEP